MSRDPPRVSRLQREACRAPGGGALDDGSLGVRGEVRDQGLMVRDGGLSTRIALSRRVGASVAGDRLLTA